MKALLTILTLFSVACVVEQEIEPNVFVGCAVEVCAMHDAMCGTPPLSCDGVQIDCGRCGDGLTCVDYSCIEVE